MIDRYLLATMLCLLLALPAGAETTTRRGGADNSALLQAQAQAQTQIQAAAAERDALQKENAKLKDELDGQKKEITRLRGEKSALQQQVDVRDSTVNRFKDANSEAVERIRETQERLDKVVEKYKELVTTLKGLEMEKAKLQDSVNAEAAQLDAYAKHNLALYEINRELLERYRRKGVWDALRQPEPMIGLGQVEMENTVEEYRARLDKERVEQTAPAQ